MECKKLIKLTTADNPVPCGRCYACLSNRQYAWSFRLTQELKVSSGAQFITLTYRPQNLPTVNGTKVPTLIKSDPQTFMKMLRKKQKTKIKYYMVGEYGKTNFRPHYHYIMFNLEKNTLNILEKTWKHGNIKIDPCTPATIHYVTGYLVNSMEYDTRQIMQRPYAAMSKGLGSNYLTNLKYHKENQRHYVQTKHGKQPLPAYYRNKIFTSREKEAHRSKMAEEMAKLSAARYAQFSKQNRGTNIHHIHIEDEQRHTDKENKLKRTAKNRLL